MRTSAHKDPTWKSRGDRVHVSAQIPNENRIGTIKKIQGNGPEVPDNEILLFFTMRISFIAIRTMLPKPLSG